MEDILSLFEAVSEPFEAAFPDKPLPLRVRFAPSRLHLAAF
jgi:hypothetical protein